MAIAPLRSLNQAADRAAEILATDPAAAQREAQAILALRPADPRALLILASARRRQGDAAAALAILAPLAKTYPNAAHTRYELGLAFAASCRPGEAAEALRGAVKLKPDLAEAWRALGEALFALGDNPGANAAFTAHDRAMVKDPSLTPAADALYQGRLAEAEQRLSAVLETRPNDPAALRLMAEALLRLGRFSAAEIVLDRALHLEPEHEGAQFSYANALFRQQKAPEALDALKALLSRRPQEPTYLNLIAACQSLLGDFDMVIAINEALLAAYPKQPTIWLNYGHALRTVGRRLDAVAAYRRAIDLAPHLGDAYWSLANLKVEALTDADETAIRAQLKDDALDQSDRLRLHYALGKSLEDKGHCDAAFDNYAAGAGIQRGINGYDPAPRVAQIARSKTLYTARFFSERRGWGSEAPDPIFIVGLPRSGSTLVEQILASHSNVEGTMELSDISIIATEWGWTGDDYPSALAKLDSDAAEALGRLYIRRTRPYRKLPRPRFVDKMPHNFLHLGLIKMILPNARVIDVRRHPMAAGFATFKQLFSHGQDYSYDLADIGQYYRGYIELMDHFNQALPGWMRTVIYEDLVENPETQIRRILDFCGLPFEENCLHFYKNDRAVRTFSSEQVRQPIFREGLDQWRRYEAHLDPLREALGDVLHRWRPGAV